MPTAFDLGRVIWEARIREAWPQAHAELRMDQTPWPPHETHPSRAADHDLAIASAAAVLKRYAVSERQP